MLCGNWGCGTLASLSVAPPLLKPFLPGNLRTSVDEFSDEDSIVLEDMECDAHSPSQDAAGDFASNALQEVAAPARNQQGTGSSGQVAELQLATVPPVTVTLARGPGSRVTSTVPSRSLTKPKTSRQPLRVINVTEHFWNGEDEEPQHADAAVAASGIEPVASASEVPVLLSLPPPPEERMQPSDSHLRYYRSVQDVSSSAYPIPSVPKTDAVAPTSSSRPYFGSEQGKARPDSHGQVPTQKQRQSSNGGGDQLELGEYHGYRLYETSPRVMSGLGAPQRCDIPTIGSRRVSAAAASTSQDFDLHSGRAPRPSSHLTDELLSPRVSITDFNRQSVPSSVPVATHKSSEADMPMRDVAPDGFPLPPQPPRRDGMMVPGSQQLPVPPPRRRRNRPSSQIRSSPHEAVLKSPLGSPTPGARMIYNSRQGFPSPGDRPGTAPVENIHTTDTSSSMRDQRRPETGGVAGARTKQTGRRPASQQRSRYHAESQRPWSHLSAQRASGNGVGIVMEGAIMQPSHTRAAEYHQQPFALVA